ncbi:MAG: polysaccharide lyase, partial [Opitutaceae bacterium]
VLFRVPVANATDLYFAYWVRFAPGFGPVKGGKLPGLTGGVTDAGATLPCCGRLVTLGKGFSSRWMFVDGSSHRLTTYMYWMDNPRPFANSPTNTIKYGGGPSHSIPFTTYPTPPTTWTQMSDTSNAIAWNSGQWHFMEQHVRLNTPGSYDGFYEAWIDGIKTAEITDTRFRASGQNYLIDAIQFETYFGGGDTSWQSPKDEYIYFDTIMVARTRIGGAP